MRFSNGTEKRICFPSHTGPSVAPLKGSATASNFHSAIEFFSACSKKTEDRRWRIENRDPRSSITAGLTPRSLLFPDLLESVIPECFYRESRRDRNWTPDPFDVAQGRGEQDSRTTIKTFGGDA